MEKAKAAVSNFVSKSGKHDTTVHESVAPAVQQEKVLPTRHEEFQQAIDKEVHQDHYHTTVQPVQDREVRPEEHHHKTVAVQEKEFNHGNHDEVQRRLQEETSQFKNTTSVVDTKQTQSVAPTVEGERVHHHVHENIQPVIQKETITPEVVHTTVPVHEVHHGAPKLHGTSVLPPKHMTDISGDGILQGGTHKEAYYEGCPKPIAGSDLDRSVGHTGTTSTTSGPHSSNMANKADPRVDSDRDGRHNLGGPDSRTTHGTDGLGHRDGSNNGQFGHFEEKKKPSLMDKLNPKKDADGDGKPGFMK